MRHWRVSSALPSAGQGTGLSGSEPQCTPVSARGWFGVGENQTAGHWCWEQRASALLQRRAVWVGKEETFDWAEPLTPDVQVSYQCSSA